MPHSGPAAALSLAAQLSLAPVSAHAWHDAELGGVRGVTVGPIENAYHPGVGYGSPAYDRTLLEARALGATWVAVTPFGRVQDLSGTGVDPTFEAPFPENRRAVARAIAMAHARGPVTQERSSTPTENMSAPSASATSAHARTKRS